MLFMFRLFLVAAGLVIVALAVATRGLVPEPEARTRIGEVPSIGRTLMQQALVPPTQLASLSIGPILSDADRPDKVVAAPLGEIAELAAPAPTPETAHVPTREPALAGDARDVIPGPVAASSTALDRLPTAGPERSSTAAPNPAVLSPAPSAEKNRAADPAAPGGPPALAFGAEPEGAHRSGSVVGERGAPGPPSPALRQANAPAEDAAKAKASEPQAGSESAAPAHSGKGKTSASKTRRPTARNAAHARRAAATPARKRVKIAKAPPQPKQHIHESASSPANLQVGPEPFEYMFAVPSSSTATSAEGVAVPSSGSSQGAR
jgi:hypothetical protein